MLVRGFFSPVAPPSSLRFQIRLPRDYYVCVHGNDYSVRPSAIGRMVDPPKPRGFVCVEALGGGSGEFGEPFFGVGQFVAVDRDRAVEPLDGFVLAVAVEEGIGVGVAQPGHPGGP